MEKNQEIFEKVSIPKAVATMAIPTIISMLVTMVYNMADTYFIGQTRNELMVSAVSLVAPVFTVYTAFGNLFGIGGSTAISRSMGVGNHERVKYFSSYCFYTVIFVGILMGVSILIFMNPILRLVGVQESTFGYAKEYLVYIAIGCPFILLSSALGSIVRSEGAAKSAMIGNIIGTITNIVLDPIMISGMGMGASGAAIATVIGNMAATAFYLIYFFKTKTTLSMRPADYRIKDGIAKEVLSIGIPTALNSLLTSTATILMNRVIVGYGDTPVAAIGIAIKVNTMVIFIVMGLCSGVQPILAYNYGSGNRKRLMGVFRFTGVLSVVIGTILTLLLISIREPVIRAFMDVDDVVTYGTQIFGVLQMSCPVIGLMFLGINTLQAFGKAIPSLLLSICRQGLIYIPFLFLFNKFWGLWGAVLAQPVTDVITVVVVMISCLFIMHRMKNIKFQNS